MATKDANDNTPAQLELDTGTPQPTTALHWEPPGGLKRRPYRRGDIAQQRRRASR
jgi:hypothetical protein